MATAKDTATAKDAEVRDEAAKAEFAAEESLREDQVAEFKSAQEQAEADYQAQAEATARATANPTPDAVADEAGTDLDWDFITNDAGQVVEPEVLEIQERQKEELAEREAKADELRRISDQGPRTDINHPKPKS